jgi:hypothetical protein
MPSLDQGSKILSIPRLGEDPLPERINLSLYGLLLSIELLHREQHKTNFAIITHRDPDADAIGSMLGMRALLTGMLPDRVVSLFHDVSATSSPHTKKLAQFGAARLEKLATILSDPEQAREWAVILVDQPSVYSPQVSSSMNALPHEADIILDHHGHAYSRDGVVIEPRAGSSSALMLRALQIATQSEMISDSWTHDSRLLSFLVSGAEIDAGISQNAEIRSLNATSFPIVDWVRSCASAQEHKVELERLRQRLDLSKYSQELLDHAQHHKMELGSCKLSLPGHDKSVNCEISYAGAASDRTLLADCADRLSKQVFSATSTPTILLVFGVIRREGESQRGSLRDGENIQAVIRANSVDIPVDAIAKLLSSTGGGRPGAGAAPLAVPHALKGTISRRSFLSEAASMVRRRLADEGDRWSGQ